MAMSVHRAEQTTFHEHEDAIQQRTAGDASADRVQESSSTDAGTTTEPAAPVLPSEQRAMFAHNQAQWARSVRSFYESVSDFERIRAGCFRRARHDGPGSDHAGEKAEAAGQVSTDAPRSQARMGPLTGRQCEIAVLIARGYSNRQIARSLVITEGTAGNHVGQIMRRLAAKNRSQVATWAVQNGLLTDDVN